MQTGLALSVSCLLSLQIQDGCVSTVFAFWENSSLALSLCSLSVQTQVRLCDYVPFSLCKLVWLCHCVRSLCKLVQHCHCVVFCANWFGFVTVLFSVQTSSALSLCSFSVQTGSALSLCCALYKLVRLCHCVVLWQCKQVWFCQDKPTNRFGFVGVFTLCANTNMV